MSNEALVPSLAVDHVPGRDLAWSAGLSMAWRTLAQTLGPEVRLADAAPAQARALLDSLAQVPPQAVPESVLMAMAGHQSGAWLQEVRRRAVLRWGEDVTLPSLPTTSHPDQLSAYATIRASLPFEVPFASSPSLLLFEARPVQSFGIWADIDAARRQRRADQVIVHHHRVLDDDDPADVDEAFVVELLTTSPESRVIVARIPPRQTFGETVQVALEMLDEDPARMGPEDTLRIPRVNLELDRAHGELQGVPVGHTTLGTLRQHLRLSLDEGGLDLVADGSFGGLSLPPRTMLCNGPFLLMLVRRGCDVPYVAVWIASRRFLVDPPTP